MRFSLSFLTVLALILSAARTAPAQTSTGKPTAVLLSGPEEGRRAPDFTLPWASRDGVGPAESPYQLWGDLGKPVVLVFFSRAFTRTCTAELRTLTERYDELFGPNVVVVGISTDPPDTQSRFAASLGLPFRLLSDPDQKVAKKYGSNDASGFLRRTVYVIGPDGKVRYRNMRFDAFNPKDYAALGAAVRKTGM
jgi:peroxiredoxin Q/BCP